MGKRKRGERVSLKVRDAIEDAAKDYRLRNLVPNAAEIHKMLLPLYGNDVPSERTIRTIAIASQEGPDKSGAWRASSSTVDARLVLPVLAAFIEQHAGARTQFSVREAEAIAMVCEVAPSAPPMFAWMLATVYIDAEAAADVQRLAALDALLAFAPWTSVAAQQRYMKAVEGGRVRQVMMWPDPSDATPLSAVKWKMVIPAKDEEGHKP